jgi:hypothetical protein
MHKPKHSAKSKPYRRKYYATTLIHRTQYIGIVICPKCGKKGYCQKQTRTNRNTKHVSFAAYLIKHYIRKNGRKNIYSHCIIYNEEAQINPLFLIQHKK